MGAAEQTLCYPDARFSYVLEKHRASVVRFLYRLVGDQVVAEALAEEVFLRAHGSLAVYTPPTVFITWLLRSAMQLARTRLPDDECVRGQDRPGSGLPETIRRAMNALPARQRAAVLMHKFERFDYSQIAAVLECSDSAAKNLLLQAYQTLRSQLTTTSWEIPSRPMSCRSLARPLATRT